MRKFARELHKPYSQPAQHSCRLLYSVQSIQITLQAYTYLSHELAEELDCLYELKRLGWELEEEREGLHLVYLY